MKLILKFSLLGVIGILFSACAGKSIDKVEDEEVYKYEKTYMAEYQTIRQQNTNYQPSFRWVQPKNKKQECKVYISINPNDDKTIKSDYSLVWDGECKDGYAYGLGREIESTMLSNLQQIGFYDHGKATDYCVGFDPINNWEISGECSYDFNKPNHYVKKMIDEKNGDLKISFEFGIMGSYNNAQMIMRTWPFFDVVEYHKAYPNFSYLIKDYSKDEFFYAKSDFVIRDYKMKANFNGFGFVVRKNGYIDSMEMNNGVKVREVILPQSYFQHANEIILEIYNQANIALEAQNKAQIIKEKYKNKICKDSVKVDFMDNNDYKAICKEEEKNAELKRKIDAKLTQIEQQKQAKRQQQNEQRLIQARESEAMAAQRKASAAEEANNQRALDSFNQSMQNLNNNMQMQQLNNNLMMNNMMPKRYDVYVH